MQDSHQRIRYYYYFLHFVNYRCVGWSAGTTVEVKQNGASLASHPLSFMSTLRVREQWLGGYVSDLGSPWFNSLFGQISFWL